MTVWNLNSWFTQQFYCGKFQTTLFYFWLTIKQAFKPYNEHNNGIVPAQVFHTILIVQHKCNCSNCWPLTTFTYLQNPNPKTLSPMIPNLTQLSKPNSIPMVEGMSTLIIVSVVCQIKSHCKFHLNMMPPLLSIYNFTHYKQAPLPKPILQFLLHLNLMLWNRTSMTKFKGEIIFKMHALYTICLVQKKKEKANLNITALKLWSIYKGWWMKIGGRVLPVIQQILPATRFGFRLLWSCQPAWLFPWSENFMSIKLSSLSNDNWEQ